MAYTPAASPCCGELGGIARLYVDPGAGARAPALLETATDTAVAHGLQPVLDVVGGNRPAIAPYERAGWQLAGTQPATWANPDGTMPALPCYVRPLPSAQGRTQAGGTEPG